MSTARILVLLRRLESICLVLIPIVVLANLATLTRIFYRTPIEAQMGFIQKIFYYHVPMAFCCFLAFFLVFCFSIAYLVRPKPFFDLMAASCAEVGVLLCGLVLITGPIWARPVWGVWWTWEPRLTTTLILFIMYSAYLILRQAPGAGETFKRYAAVFGIIAFADVPLVYFSVHLWRGLHPTVFKKGGGGLAPEMLTTFMWGLGAVTLLAALLVLLRLRSHMFQLAVQSLGEEIDDYDGALNER